MLDRLETSARSRPRVRAALLQIRGGVAGSMRRVEQLRIRRIPFCEAHPKERMALRPRGRSTQHYPLRQGSRVRSCAAYPGLNQELTPHGPDPGDADLDRLRRTLAMAIGRARKSVVVGYKPGEESSLIGLLDPSTYDLINV